MVLGVALQTFDHFVPRYIGEAMAEKPEVNFRAEDGSGHRGGQVLDDNRRRLATLRRFRLRELGQVAARRHELSVEVIALALRIAELAAMFGEALFGDRDEQLHLIAFGTA